jgi:CheY-like chemotaxis protein
VSRVNGYVLVAEDDVKQAEVIRRYLEREGHSSLVVHDGRAAMTRCGAGSRICSSSTS